MSIPSASELVEEATHIDPQADVNAIHAKTYELMMRYKEQYYERKVDAFLNKLCLEHGLRERIKRAMLEHVVVEGVEYNNFMEEASRRISQTFQVVSGNIAEICCEKELIRVGLRKDVNYKRKIERTDIVVYFPSFQM